MTKEKQDISDALKNPFLEKGSCFIAIVTDNGKDKDTMTVESLDGVTYYNVRKRAAEDGKKGLLVRPVKDSSVIVARIEDSDQLFVAMYSEIEEVKTTLEDHIIKLDKDGLSIDLSTGKFELKNNQENLKSLITDLVSEIMKITVTTGTGPSGTPINMPQLQKISQRIPKLFT